MDKTVVPRSGVQELFFQVGYDQSMEKQWKLEGAVDGAPSQIPTLKFSTPPAPGSPARGMTLATE